MTVSLAEHERMRLGVLASGSGTNLQAILDARAAGELDADIALVICNRKGAGAIGRARAAGVPVEVIPHRSFVSREAFEEAMIRALRQADVNFVALAGFMRILTRRFLAAFHFRVVNIHPSLLPAFPGIEAQQQALDHGVKYAGCTVHFVDDGTDSGPIIGQAVVQVYQDDDVAALRQRILAEEHKLYPWALQMIAEGRVVCLGPTVRILGQRPAGQGK